MRSSATPRDLRISTARMAEPPDQSILSELQERIFRLTCGEHGVEQQNPPFSDIFRELVIEQLWLCCFLVALNQDLANPYRPAAISETLLHCLSSSHDGDTAYLPLKSNSQVAPSGGSCDCLFYYWEMVQSFLDKKANDAIRIENKIGSLSVSITDDTVDC